MTFWYAPASAEADEQCSPSLLPLYPPKDTTTSPPAPRIALICVWSSPPVSARSPSHFGLHVAVGQHERQREELDAGRRHRRWSAICGLPQPRYSYGATAMLAPLGGGDMVGEVLGDGLGDGDFEGDADGLGGSFVPVNAVTVSLSTFGPPFAVVAVARIVLVPAASVQASPSGPIQVSQFAVAGNDTPDATTAPLTAMSIGRSTVVPLAYRSTTCARCRPTPR